MKYMKKALAAVSAVLICISSAVPFTASADLVDKCNDALDEIIASWDRETVVAHIKKAYDRVILAYNNGEGNYYKQIYLGTTIVPKDANTFSEEKLNEKIAPYKIEKKDGKYTINISNPEDKAKVHAELVKSNEIVSISEDYKVLKAGLYSINSIQLSTELTKEELSGVFKSLNLQLVADTDEDFTTERIYRHIYRITNPISTNLSKEQFDALCEIMKKECYLDIDYSKGTNEDNTKYISVSIFDDVLYGDITGTDENGVEMVQGDGVVDMKDLIKLSQVLMGDTEFKGDQKQRADVAKNGNVDLADLSTLKQYIMHDNVVLGK